MAGTRAPFASLAALAAVASAQAQEDAQKSAVEAAKRDLQSLPSAQRAVDETQRKSLFPTTSLLPSLAVGAPPAAGKPPEQKEKAATEKTGGWLVDGVNQLEAEAQSTLAKTEAGSRAEAARPDALGERTSSTANPFSGYLDQWLSPADKALLAGNQNLASSSSAPWETRHSDFSPAVGVTEKSASLTQPTEFSGLDLFTQNQPRTNPYLAGENAVETAVPFTASTPGRETPNTLTPIDSAAPAQLLPPVAPRVEQAQAAPAAPPTSPLVDDRKYFPQLRRF